MKDYYKILGIPHTNDKKVIRQAWLKMANLHHPDHNPDDPLAEEYFKQVQEAYRILSDDFLKSQYDTEGLSVFFQINSDESKLPHYFYVYCPEKNIMQFSEVHINYVYSGSGRVFRKPSFAGFKLTGSPFVSHRVVMNEGRPVKETQLSYILCPLKSGTLIINSATIRIYGKLYESDELSLLAHPAKCFFTENRSADGKPLEVTLHYEFPSGKEPKRLSESKKNHLILMPRSRVAVFFHFIGTALKVACSVWGMFMATKYYHLNPLLGFLSGNLFGGINCYLMYKLSGVKSKYDAVREYNTVRDYQESGYCLGESSGIPLVKGNKPFLISRLFI